MLITQTENPKGTIEYRECMVPPSFTNDSRPIYPEIARLAEIEGRVFVRVLIDEQGRAVKAEIVKRVPADTAVFDKAAIDYIMSGHFKAAEQNGKNVKIWMTIPVKFELQDKRISPGQGVSEKEMVR
jgi:protein TonB